MTNVLLITPLNIPFKDIEDDINTRRKLAPKYPVGLLCIGAYVKSNIPDVDIRIVDYNTEMPRYFAGDRLKYTLEGMLSYGLSLVPFFPDIIGISAMFDSNYTDMRKTIAYLRKRYPSSIIVMGGHLASACYKEFLEKFPGLDAVCYGEGERPFSHLVEHTKYDPPEPSWGRTWHLSNHTSWATRYTIEHPLYNSVVEDLDTIPPYDLNMLMWPGDYLNTNDDLFALGTEKHEKDIYMFATRGCPYHCIFCASQFVHGHKVRSYSAKRILSDIMHYNVKYGMTSFPFLDDHFLADKQKALDILDFIHNWGFTCRIFNLNYIHVDREIIQALKRTGSDRILITLDGLDERFLRRVVLKPADFRKAKEVIKICREEEIPIFANIIVGYPGETKEDIDNGIKAMRSMGANWYSILIAGPLRGSELRRVCKEKGYLERENVRTDYYTANITTPDFTAEWIKKKAYEINLDLNFVNNWDMRHGEFETPLFLFGRVIRLVPDHMFAHYFSAICCKQMKMPASFGLHRTIYYGVLKENLEWREWAEHFNLKEI